MLDRKFYNDLVNVVLEVIVTDLKEHADRVWDIMLQEKFDEVDPEFVENVIMDRMLKIYISQRQKDDMLMEIYKMLNVNQDIQ